MEVFDLIADLGLPIAGGLVMGYFIFLNSTRNIKDAHNKGIYNEQ